MNQLLPHDPEIITNWIRMETRRVKQPQTSHGKSMVKHAYKGPHALGYLEHLINGRMYRIPIAIVTCTTGLLQHNVSRPFSPLCGNNEDEK
ncbi:hypothetical protein EUGRSUZ_C01239 [Eucalyptus grandis]|uniref:Uncharacterized protein n=2 Tax=Eucalyptus grandis TaxID=71139 RepID=A0ACC3LFZ6_EUCGR|nr:hypothetical protein EUGRSUZ_C01239 [Eucalyptus grandis]